MKTSYWIIAFIICFYLTFEYGVNPLLVYGLAGILFLLVWGLSAYLKGAHEDKMKARVNDIKKKFPRAYKDFTVRNGIYVSEYNASIESLERVAYRAYELWEKEENEIKANEEKLRKVLELKSKKLREDAERIKKIYPDGFKKWEKNQKGKYFFGVTDQAISDAENEIGKIDKELKYNNWTKKQIEFAKRCRELRDKLLGNYGCYSYNIKIPDNSVNTIENYTIWQMFPFSYCIEKDLDYALFPYVKRNAEIISQGEYTITDSIAKKIAEYINKIYSEEETALYFCPPIDEKYKNWYENNYIIISGFLDDSIKNEQIYDPTIDNALGIDSNIEEWVKHIKRRVIIIDVTTENSRLKNICNNVIDVAIDKHPLLSYISIFKGYDREEMEEQINDKRKQIAEEEEDKRKKEEEKRVEENARKSFYKAISLWNKLDNGLHYSYLFYYYPVKCDFEPTEEEWSNRRLVWDFKNTPGKTSSSDHDKALAKIIPMVKNKLATTFGADNLKYLTFVCIPASSQVKTQARYEEFSNRLCEESGMINAYTHITVIKEKEERRSGGTSINTEMLSFDEDFFKGKYVLLFDDIITRGDSMRTFSRKMQSLGAKVVAGISLGKTKHERPIQGSIPDPFTSFETSSDMQESPHIFGN